MAEITAALVKQLREMTGGGMMDCKKALTETDGDLEKSVDLLRKKGIASAEKRAGRIAALGLIGVATNGLRGALVEVNAETDFVGKDSKFKAFTDQVTKIALEVGGDLEALKAASYPDSGRSVAEELTQLIAVIKENMALRRTAVLSVDVGAIGAYMHGQEAPGLGKIGVLVALESSGDAGALAPLAKQLAMHVAATAPQAIDTTDVDPAVLDRERAVLAEQARASGKPEEIVEKMVEGRLRKYYQEVCLLEQTFVVDGETKVRKVLDKAATELGSPINIAGYLRYQLGEGIDQGPGDDFADEVAKLAG